MVPTEAGTVLIERPVGVRGLVRRLVEKRKSLQTPQRSLKAHVADPHPRGGLASSFSVRRSVPTRRDRRAQPDRYPDLGLRTSLPPSRSCDRWPWEFVTRYSGATVPDSHGVPCHLTANRADPRASAFQRTALLIGGPGGGAKHIVEKRFLGVFSGASRPTGRHCL